MASGTFHIPRLCLEIVFGAERKRLGKFVIDCTIKFDTVENSIYRESKLAMRFDVGSASLKSY